MGQIAFHLYKLLKKSKEEYLIGEWMSCIMQFWNLEAALRCWEYKYLHIISGATEIRMMVTRQIPVTSLYISDTSTQTTSDLAKKHFLILLNFQF